MSNIALHSGAPMDEYIRYLDKQGLTLQDAEILGLRVCLAPECQEYLGTKVKHPGILIPYGDTGRFRYRMLGGDVRYMSPRGVKGSPPYFPPGPKWDDIIADKTKDIGITEGEFKAYSACRGDKEGTKLPFIGIAGVDAQAQLLEEDIEWHGRRVFIAFDKDAGRPVGESAPRVARALGRLCSELIRRGAKVWVLQLPGEVDEKMGLDDYINGGGLLASLVNGAVQPPDYCAYLAYLLENCVFVNGMNTPHIYNFADESMMTISAFHDAHQRELRITRDGDKPKVERVSKIMIMHKDCTLASGYTMNPKHGKEVIMEGGLPLINLWTPWPDFPPRPEGVESVIPDWERYVKGLFGEEDLGTEDNPLPMWQWVACWTAYMFAHPDRKCTQAVLVKTQVKGVGKSLYGEIIGALAGGTGPGSHYLETTLEDFAEKHNPQMKGKTWVLLNELSITGRVTESDINNFITSETFKLEPKNKDPIFIKDLRRLYMTANADAPMRLSPGQRRVLVVYPPRTHDDTRGEWGHWVGTRIASIKHDPVALGEIREWLASCLDSYESRHGAWNPTAPVPITEAALETEEASMTGNQLLVKTAIDWMEEHNGVGALIPSLRALMNKVASGIDGAVKARGGKCLLVKCRIDGQQKEVKVWDLHNRLPEYVKKNRSHWVDTNRCKELGMEHDALMLSASLWTVLCNMRNTQSGGSPLSDKY